MKNKPLYPVTFTCRPCGMPPAEVLAPVLAAARIPREDLVEFWEKGKLKFSVYAKERRQAERLLKAFKAQRPKGISASLRVLPPSGWKTRWKKYFKPLRITDTVRIVPLRLKDVTRQAPGVTDIYIDSSMAFGTGSHPTTAAMAGFIEGLAGRFDDFLDAGTGTGILSLVAAANGARTIRAFDTDREAVETAAENFSVNGLEVDSLTRSDIRRFPGKRQFDLVAANILAVVLLEARDALRELVRPGKYLAVSGIEQGEYDAFRKRFETRELRRLALVKRTGWVSVLYRKVGGK